MRNRYATTLTDSLQTARRTRPIERIVPALRSQTVSLPRVLIRIRDTTARVDLVRAKTTGQNNCMSKNDRKQLEMRRAQLERRVDDLEDELRWDKDLLELIRQHLRETEDLIKTPWPSAAQRPGANSM